MLLSVAFPIHQNTFHLCPEPSPPIINLAYLRREMTLAWTEKKARAAMALALKEKKSRTEVYFGDEICREKTALLLTEMGLPSWLLQLQDIKEFGYVIETGFVWVKQKGRREQKLEEVEGKIVHYDTVITAYVEPKKIKKLTGVKTKELFIWITLSEIHVDDPSAGSITFKTPSGLSKSFPAS